MTTDMERQYHHGNLRRALMDEALKVIEEEGPSAVSLRDLARRIGVSHAAPAHHFADKTALFTAIATEGQNLLTERMEAASEADVDVPGHGRFLAVGLAYVRFALEKPAHILVMFQPSLYDNEDSEFKDAGLRCFNTLFAAAAEFKPDADPAQVSLAGWSLMHGLTALWQGGNLRQFGDDPVELAKWIAAVALQ